MRLHLKNGVERRYSAPLEGSAADKGKVRSCSGGALNRRQHDVCCSGLLQHCYE